jgi:hypothetical protein
MFPAPILLYLLLVTTPASLVYDGPISHGLIIAVAAVLVAIVALRIRPREAGFLIMLIRPAAIVAAVPMLWIVIQVLPLNISWLVHPIWKSAATALGRPIAGSISIDPGLTLIALARYLSLAAIAFVTAAIAIDRHRAGWILFALTVATTLSALTLLAAGRGDLTFLSDNAALAASYAATDCAALGVILAVAAALHMFEGGNAGADPRHSAVWLWSTFAACFIAYAICCFALIFGATSEAYFAVACGLAVLAAAFIVRQFHLGPWGLSAVISVALVVAIAALLFQSNNQSMSLMLGFATRAPEPMLALTQRILTETNWVGAGAGTFAAVLPIYRDIDELGTGAIPPTAVAAITVEMGWPFFGATLMAAIVFVIVLLRGAARRGRDSTYSVAGASCVVSTALLAFGNAGLFSTPASVITAVIVGVAIAQSKGRSIRYSCRAGAGDTRMRADTVPIRCGLSAKFSRTAIRSTPLRRL